MKEPIDKMKRLKDMSDKLEGKLAEEAQRQAELLEQFDELRNKLAVEFRRRWPVLRRLPK